MILRVIEGATAQGALGGAVGVFTAIGGSVGIRQFEAAGPLPDIAAEIKHAVGAGAGGIAADGDGGRFADIVVEVGAFSGGWFVAPREEAGIVVATGMFPLGFAGQATSGPGGIGVGLRPVHMRHRQVGGVGLFPTVVGRWRADPCCHTARILRIRHLGLLHPEAFRCCGVCGLLLR